MPTSSDSHVLFLEVVDCMRWHAQPYENEDLSGVSAEVMSSRLNALQLIGQFSLSLHAHYLSTDASCQQNNA